MELDTVHHTDLLTLCGLCDPQSVDMILCDLPYGTTRAAWDEVIPFDLMWDAFKRVIKPRGAVVLTASQPFTSRLVVSNIDMFRCEWIWSKNHHSNFLNANKQPLKMHESVLVFSDGGTNYYPVMMTGKAHKRGGSFRDSDLFGDFDNLLATGVVDYYPTSILVYGNPNGDPKNKKLHPTQKPVALFEYLIRTYTLEGEIVLDPCVGSGTTAIAARNANRRYIVGDSDEKYIKIARNRIAAPFTQALF